MTKSFLQLGGSLALFFATNFLFAAEDDKPKPETETSPDAKTVPAPTPSTSDPAPAKPFFITSGDIVGQVTKVSDSSITVRVTWYTVAPGKGSRNPYGHWHHGTSGRSPQAMYQHMLQMQQQLARQQASRMAHAKTTEHQQEYTFNFTSDAQARTKHLPPKADGGAYTPDEVHKIKGNPNVVGYQAEKSELKVGQLVEAHLVHLPKETDNLVRWALIINENTAKIQPAQTKPATSKP